MPNTLLLIDAYSLIYRAFYAIRQLTGPSGEPVNAIYGFTKMLKKLQADYRPTHWATVFDLGAPEQRLKLLPTYKAHRPPTPPDLEKQLPSIRAMLQSMRIPIVEIVGEEADDIIATLAEQAVESGQDVLIASSDKDFMQIVGPHVRLIRPDGKAAKVVDEDGVEARFGIRPSQIVDFLSLIGDSADNIPGVPGVGEKTASQLLRNHGTLDNLLRNVSENAETKLHKSLLQFSALLRANRDLIALRNDLALPIGLESLRAQPPDKAALAALYRNCGFKSLLAELGDAGTHSEDLFNRA